MSTDSIPLTNNVPGEPLSTKSKVLETGAAMTQVSDPPVFSTRVDPVIEHVRIRIFVQ